MGCKREHEVEEPLGADADGNSWLANPGGEDSAVISIACERDWDIVPTTYSDTYG
jgi:hypothetical protein